MRRAHASAKGDDTAKLIPLNERQIKHRPIASVARSPSATTSL